MNFDVKRGEFIGIMGSSGSGKSTLLNILGMLDKPTSGKYRIDGIAVETLSDYELTTIRNVKIGFVFQAFNLFAPSDRSGKYRGANDLRGRPQTCP